MKPFVLNNATDSFHSFGARLDIKPDINNRWHCHSAIEIVYFKKGHGRQFIGDNISDFNAGDLVIVGSNIPHFWRFDDKYFDKTGKNNVEVYVVHFKEDFWGETFLNLHENLELKKVIACTKQAIQVKGKSRKMAAEIIIRLVNSKGFKRITLLMDFLNEVAQCKNTKNIVSVGFQPNLPEGIGDRIQTVYNYTLSNFKKKIELKEIADVARMSPHSFCKFFKSSSQKTYTQFVNEVRIGQACKLLINSKLSVKEICFESGFLNFTSFHKSFRSITGKTPLIYQKLHE
ncbi:AraC family transcriptional regulator [Pedobacter aquatilis]|uniref:AraC family transcriptional regulator n=1 Tax=Pedobacter aquatilis TaxID=351343 RepID=UPI002931A32F|nr:AraC family transcriptional regulator [Pedobacter aquatilis]